MHPGYGNFTVHFYSLLLARIENLPVNSNVCFITVCGHVVAYQKHNSDVSSTRNAWPLSELSDKWTIRYLGK